MSCQRKAAVPTAITAGSSRNTDYGFREYEAYYGDGEEEHRAYLYAVNKALVYPVEQLRSAAESAKRLESLSQSHNTGIHKIGNPRHYRHSRYGSVAVSPRSDVQHYRGNARQSLSGERRGAVDDYFLGEGA